ncbi:MAG TPA: TlpA disulfide reductase family protein [Polyangiaceae bacterium]|jgi:thiol-disulfide isomerase/thioredoxin
MLRLVGVVVAFAACGGARPTPTVTVEPLPPPPIVTASRPLLRPVTHAEMAPEVLAVGKVTIVHFFATWCGPCRDSMPALERVYEAHRPELAVIGIAEDDEEQGIREFVALRGATFETRLGSSENACLGLARRDDADDVFDRQARRAPLHARRLARR